MSRSGMGWPANLQVLTVTSVKPGLLVILAIVLQACSTNVAILTPIDPEQDRGPRPGTIDVSSIADAIPKNEPRSKYGNPQSYVVNGKTYRVMNSSEGFTEQGIASWYGEKFHGRRTSSGETYDMYAMTAAHKSLPLPTYVEVRNLQSGLKIVVKVNDRGPFHENRVIDLSYAAASKLGILGKGTGLVEVRVIDQSYISAPQKTVPHAPVTTVSLSNQGPVLVADASIKTTSISGFYIQVGAFSQVANARKMYDKLALLGNHTVSIAEAEVNGGRIYRVKIGPINDVEVADRIVSDLASIGINEHQITMN